MALLLLSDTQWKASIEKLHDLVPVSVVRMIGIDRYHRGNPSWRQFLRYNSIRPRSRLVVVVAVVLDEDIP